MCSTIYETMAKGKKRKKKAAKTSRLASKKEMRYLLVRLRSVDVAVTRASVTREVDETEALHINHYPQRRATWDTWKASERLNILLAFLVSGFCRVLEKHTVGGERFAHFLVSWYNFVSTLAVPALGTDESKGVWLEVTSQEGDVDGEDRSALVFSIAKCVYSHLHKQVSSI